VPRRATSASLASGRAQRMFSRTLAPNSRFSCSASATPARRLRELDPPQIDAVDLDPARVGIEEAQQQREAACSCRRRWDEQRRQRAAGRFEGDVAEHGTPG